MWPDDAIWWQRSGSTLAQVMSCLKVLNCYLNQCVLLINDVLWHWPEWDFTISASPIILENEFEKYYYDNCHISQVQLNMVLKADNLATLGYHFYPRPVMAFGYCRCLRLSVCVCVCVYVCVCVRQSSVCPDDNLSPAQATITKFGPEVQNTLIKMPIVLGVHWPWPSRSNWT